MMCDCSVHGDYVALRAGADAFAGELVIIRSNSKTWTALYRCRDCNQHWQIDDGAELDRRTPLAIKIADPEAWHAFDDRPVRRRYFIDSHGGLTDEICHWKDCSNPCVNGIVFCPDHASSQ